MVEPRRFFKGATALTVHPQKCVIVPFVKSVSHTRGWAASLTGPFQGVKVEEWGCHLGVRMGPCDPPVWDKVFRKLRARCEMVCATPGSFSSKIRMYKQRAPECGHLLVSISGSASQPDLEAKERHSEAFGGRVSGCAERGSFRPCLISASRSSSPPFKPWPRHVWPEPPFSQDFRVGSKV